VPLSDVVGFAADQLRRAYGQLAASERALAEANATLESKLAQLEAANRVLQHRTEAIVSLQDIGQTLVTLADLDDLALACVVMRAICAGPTGRFFTTCGLMALQRCWRCTGGRVSWCTGIWMQPW